jgi:hypothetical protein
LDDVGRFVVLHDGAGGEYIGLFVEFDRSPFCDEGWIDGRFGDCSLDVQRLTCGPNIAPD